MMTEKILFVDDEERVLAGIRRSLYGRFELDCAPGPEPALELLQAAGPYAIVVSDMRMPGMDGASLLKHVKQHHPGTVRMMLTGNNDQLTASSAINKGEVFRFLNKPCDVTELEEALKAGLDHYRLLSAEKELLERTLQGSVSVMTEVLAAAQPETYGALDRLHNLAMAVMTALGRPEDWAIETAVMLSRVGFIGISDELVQKYNSGQSLGPDEQREFDEHARIGADLVVRIPRLEAVADIIRCQAYDYSSGDGEALVGEAIPFGARLLKVVNEHDRLRQHGESAIDAVKALRRRGETLDNAIVDALESVVTGADDGGNVSRLAIGDLRDGMVIMEDVVNDKGVLIICEGQTITPAIRTHFDKFQKMGVLSGTVLVQCPEPVLKAGAA